jgi:cyclic pyranopterin phosphate synthase
MHGADNSLSTNRDRFGRTINYLRLSVTDRCNLRCSYCMPEEGVPLRSHNEILRYEELLRIARAAARLGIEKVRVTGGEPLVRKGLVGFLARLNSIPNLAEVVLTTNGLLLASLAGQLRQAGVGRVNISLDSLEFDRYAKITRGGDLADVLAGIKAAEKAGLQLKLNMVVMRDINDSEIEAFAELSLNRPWSIRFIEYMPTIRARAWREKVVPGAEILERLQKKYRIVPLATGRMCGPSRPFRIEGAQGSIGIITPMSDHFCGSCNRIRVTSAGLAKSCLLSEQTVDLKPYLDQDDDLLCKALRQVIGNKVDHHQLADDFFGPAPFNMSGIGG